VEAKTGAEVWRERIGGNYSASPIYADGNIYFCSEEGKITVVKPGRQFSKVSENTLPDGFMASPAAVGNALYLRTRTHLYRIEKSGQEAPSSKLQRNPKLQSSKPNLEFGTWSLFGIWNLELGAFKACGNW
jgi:outer membrane protein assembly factor BamB